MAGVANPFETTVHESQVELFHGHFLGAVGQVHTQNELRLHPFATGILTVFVHRQVLADAEKVGLKGTLKLRQLPVHYVLVKDHGRSLVYSHASSGPQLLKRRIQLIYSFLYFSYTKDNPLGSPDRTRCSSSASDIAVLSISLSVVTQIQETKVNKFLYP